jgi:hypothetical protein
MKKARLQKLVNHLYKVGSDIATGKLVDKFDMATWGDLEKGGVFKARKDMSCMTAACAIGHAGAIFKTDGFKLVFDLCDDEDPEEVEYCTNVIPEYRGEQGFDAVAAFFQISNDEAEHLFAPRAYDKYNSLGQPIAHQTGPGEVADRIRTFIEDN